MTALDPRAQEQQLVGYPADDAQVMSAGVNASSMGQLIERMQSMPQIVGALGGSQRELDFKAARIIEPGRDPQGDARLRSEATPPSSALGNFTLEQAREARARQLAAAQAIALQVATASQYGAAPSQYSGRPEQHGDALVPADAAHGNAVVAGGAAHSSEIEAHIARLPMRDLAREALRARLIAFGSGRRTHSAYETIFVMLAFAVMVLVVVPALIPLVHAITGHG